MPNDPEKWSDNHIARRIRVMLSEKIHRYGYTVMSTPSPVTAGPLNYTIGLWPSHKFEILNLGLSMHAASAILGGIARSLRAGLEIETGVEYGPSYQWVDRAVKFEICDTEDPVLWDRCVCQVENYYGRRDIPIWQLVVCDEDGFFPEDPRYNRMYMDDLQVCMYKKK